METFLQDLRFGVRQLRKNPGFTTTAVLTLALGIGINATRFSLVSAFLLRRPPGRDPEHIAVVSTIDPAGGSQADASDVSTPNFLAWRETNHVFSSMAAAYLYSTASLTAQRESESVRSANVTANFFSVLDVAPELGRTFAAGEDQPGQDHEVILSHALWERRFASDPSIIGRIIRLNRENYTVVGVMPTNFHLLGFTTQLWTPLVLNTADESASARRSRFLYVFARMKPGVTIDQARAEMATFARRAEQSFPETEKGWGATVRTLQDFLGYIFGIRAGLAILMTTVAFVLMIACANVSGLLLARAAVRRKELAIRLSLGAARLRLIRQLLTEGFVIAVLGGGMGLLMSYWGINFMRVETTTIDGFNSTGLSLDRNVVLFCAGISMLCALLCALVPSLKASRADVASSLKDESRCASAGRAHSRLRTIMVTGEIALALFLLVGTNLLFFGVSRIEHQDLGFRSDHLLTADVTLDQARYKDAAQQTAFLRDLLPRLQQIPSAQAVALVSNLPSTWTNSVTLKIQGQPDLPANQAFSALDDVISLDYFRVAGIPLLRGRTFSELDNATTSRVVIVNQKFVDRYLHGQDPLGKQIRLDIGGAAAAWAEIVGVVGNVRTSSEMPDEDPEVYEPFLQRPIGSFSLMLRASGDPTNLASAMRSVVAEIDPELPLAHLMSMSAVIERQKNGNPFFLAALASFAGMALLLAAIGIYGLIAYSVGQRTHEIGIRMALGARKHDVLQMILRQGLRMAAIGGAVGLAISLPLPKVFSATFYGWKFSEPRIYFAVPVVILLVSILATYIPARRAARIDPMRALRTE
jgi:putative ABC transport system permease protein